MKILFPIGVFYPANTGGPSNSIYWHSCYLKENNIDTYIITTNLKITNKHNIKLNTWNKTEAGNVIYCKTHFPRFPIRAFWETIKKIWYVDLVHYSSAFYSLTIYTIFFSILLGRKVILSPRGEFFANALTNPLKHIVIMLYSTVYKKIIFHATSHEEFQTIKKLFPKSKVIIQPNFINFKTSEKKILERKNIVFLGILCKVKKIENLIQALYLSDKFKNSESKLLIAGAPLVKRDFFYKDMLLSLISRCCLNDKIEFVGEVFDEKKIKFLSDAYILILPSESENFGNVVTEALSQSTPVIASTGTPWKILQERHIGWWVNNDDKSLKDAIDKALSLSDSEYLNKSKESLKLVLEKYNINTSPDNKWLELYQLVISEQNFLKDFSPII